jgi:hypothetical protein
MDTKKILLSDASVEAKLAAITILLGKEMPKLEARVESVQKMQGPQGDRGVAGQAGLNGVDGKDGRDGKDGCDGKDGADGADGADGVSVTDARIDFDGSLVIVLSTGREINVGEVVAPDLAEKIKLVTSGGGTSQSVLDSIAALQATIASYGTFTSGELPVVGFIEITDAGGAIRKLAVVA